MKTKEIVKQGHMFSFGGALIDLMNPHKNEYYLEDIAHGLAMNCRWNGATKKFYSVAEHCLRMHSLVPPYLRPTAILHDAEEAYWGDMIRPLKMMLTEEQRELMRSMRKTIFLRFGVSYLDILEYDNSMLEMEYENLIVNNIWQTMSPDVAKERWLYLAKKYTKHENS